MTDPPSIEQLCARLKLAAADSGHWHSVGSALRKSEELAHEDPTWFLVWGFEYMLLEPDADESRERWGTVFAPWIETQEGVFPPPLGVAPDEALQLWDSLADESDPIIASRLNDLLWERRWGARPYDYAISAIDAYAGVAAGTSWNALYRAESLVRGLELSRQVNDRDRLAMLASRALSDARDCIASEEWAPGVSLRLIEALMKLPVDTRPTDLDAVLTEALDRYESDPFIYQTVLELQMQRAPTARGDLRLREIQRWRDEAAKREGLLRLMHLERALELAHVHGFKELAETIRRDIQSMSQEDFGLKSVSGSVTIPSEKVYEFIDWFLQGVTWVDCLTRFGHRGGNSPSGDHGSNLEQIRKNMSDFPIQFLAQKVVLGQFNVPIRKAASPEEHAEIALTQQEAVGINLWGIFAADVLDKIRDRFGVPTRGEVAAFFETALISREVATRLAGALRRYWDGDFDDASHIIAPRLETIVRELARQAGLAIIKEPAGARPGGVRGLGELIAGLEGVLDESWRSYLRCLLSEPVGVNLRNRIGHGLSAVISREEAALLIHAACYLRLLAVGPKTTEHLGE